MKQVTQYYATGRNGPAARRVKRMPFCSGNSPPGLVEPTPVEPTTEVSRQNDNDSQQPGVGIDVPMVHITQL